jgi:hypothetical protein
MHRSHRPAEKCANCLAVDLAGEVTAQRQAVGAHDHAKGIPVAPGDLVEDARDFACLKHLPPTMLAPFNSSVVEESHSPAPFST